MRIQTQLSCQLSSGPILAGIVLGFDDWNVQPTLLFNDRLQKRQGNGGIAGTNLTM